MYDRYYKYILNTFQLVNENECYDIPNISELDIDYLINIAIKNNVGYHVIKHVLKNNHSELNESQTNYMNKLIKNGDQIINNQKKEIKYLKENLDDFRVFKTYRDYERIPSDIDIYLFEPFMEIIQKKFSQYELKESSSYDCALYSQDQIKLHFHNKIKWADAIYFDQDLLQEYRTVIFSGVNIKCPTMDVDVLLHLAHINYEPMHITISDFIYLYSISDKFDYDFVYNMARKHNWPKTMKRTMGIINTISKQLINNPNVFPVKPHSINKEIQFPYHLSRNHIISSFLEKKLFRYALSKTYKVLSVLYTGNTYDGYYDPSENALRS